MSQIDIFELGEKVKAARRGRRITQVDLAASTGVSRARIEAFENGRAPEIALSSVLRLMNAVGLDLRPTIFNDGRPTLDDIRAEDREEADAPRMGR